MTKDDEPVRDLVRSPSGLIHRTDCSALRGVADPWTWAEGRPISEVRHAVGTTGSTVCRRCNPLIGELPVTVSLSLLDWAGSAPRRPGVEAVAAGLTLAPEAYSIRGAEREVTATMISRGYRPVSNWHEERTEDVIMSASRLFEKAS